MCGAWLAEPPGGWGSGFALSFSPWGRARTTAAMLGGLLVEPPPDISAAKAKGEQLFSRVAQEVSAFLASDGNVEPLADPRTQVHGAVQADDAKFSAQGRADWSAWLRVGVDEGARGVHQFVGDPTPRAPSSTLSAAGRVVRDPLSLPTAEGVPFASAVCGARAGGPSSIGSCATLSP
eukprot:1978261-Pyramimonas_sp.AAC.1